ncbi:ricin-type beta-trefoil lectin domain protein [Actinokineospora globicatena]|nr:ricin-type beta-trefoil lectin domain protein [Actinokineospora globicatena]
MLRSATAATLAVTSLMVLLAPASSASTEDVPTGKLMIKSSANDVCLTVEGWRPHLIRGDACRDDENTQRWIYEPDTSLLRNDWARDSCLFGDFTASPPLDNKLTIKPCDPGDRRMTWSFLGGGEDPWTLRNGAGHSVISQGSEHWIVNAPYSETGPLGKFDLIALEQPQG